MVIRIEVVKLRSVVMVNPIINHPNAPPIYPFIKRKFIGISNKWIPWWNIEIIYWILILITLEKFIVTPWRLFD